jgi:two-component system sensor histidine kinase CiaH
MKFHKNSLKLAGLYLAVMMVISLFFSANVYQLSVQEFDRGLRRPGPDSAVNRLPLDGLDRFTRDELLQEREGQYQDAKDRILQRLILVNILILLGGGALSYYLALRTLRPIEEAHAAQSRFTADASHELRTPIAAMQAETEVALMDPKLTLAKAKDILNSNLEELTKLTQLSEGLLALAQAENIKLSKTELSLTDVVQKAINRIVPLAEQKNILVSFSSAEDIKIYGDETSLVEALVIILDNAVKYSPPKSEIIVSTESESKNALIKITDTGIGIKATEIPHIFDRFYRADSARSKQQANGYGIGLAIAKNIIDMHQGKIDVTSKPLVGTTFSIRLPRTTK